MLAKQVARPSAATPRGDAKQALELYHKIQRSRAKLVGPDGTARSLPVSLGEFLSALLGDLAAGGAAAIVAGGAPLTTVEAARMLGVSRQFLVNLLERREIPYHMVGTHRRVYARDVLAYKAKRDSERRRILDELTHAEAEEGLYDLEPPDDPAR